MMIEYNNIKNTNVLIYGDVMKSKYIIIVFLLLMAVMILSSCAGDKDTIKDGDTTVAPTTDTAAPVIEKETSSATHIFFNGDEELSLFEGSNCSFEWYEDKEKGQVLKITASGIRNRFNFDYGKFIESLGLEPVKAEKYPFAIVEFKTSAEEDRPSETSDLKLGLGAEGSGECSYSDAAMSVISSEKIGWQRALVDMSGSEFKGDINSILISGAGGVSDEEVYYIYSVRLVETLAEGIVAVSEDESMNGLKEKLTESEIDGVSFEKIKAPDEDESVSFWFDHQSERKAQNDITPSDKDSYLIRMPKNSIEGCQFFLAPKEDRTFSVSLTPFKDTNGHTLRTELFYEEYFLVDGVMIPDPLPPLKGEINVSGGNSQGFYIKVWAESDEPAGLYSADLQIKDAKTDKVIKIAKVYTYIWDFELSEKTEMKTAVTIWTDRLYAPYKEDPNNTLTNEEIYKMFYDFLLENRLTADRIPYSLTDERAWDYLTDPRVTTFRIDDLPNEIYDRIRKNEDVFKKGYFYRVDEPNTKEKLELLKTQGELLADRYPEYRMISPFFTNLNLDDSTDQIEFMRQYVSIWDVKASAFTPREYSQYQGVEYLMNASQEKKFGKFEDRMARETAEGDELWVYFCCGPAKPFVNWMLTGDGTEPIVSVWQCRNTKCTGMLYWSVNWWCENMLSYPAGEPVWGDGVLLYPGTWYGQKEPVSSLRLENIRDGIEDYQMLHMVEEIEGAEAADKIAELVSVDVIAYTRDDGHLHAARVILGEKVESLMNK